MSDNNNSVKTYSRKLMIPINAAVAALLIVADQLIKAQVVDKLMGKEAYVLIPGVLELDYLENTGSAFGIFRNQKVLILFIGLIFLAIMLFIMFKLPLKRKFIPSHILLSMVIAGGIGNMIDRFRLDYVIDFISFVLIHFPIFNFADCCVVIGVIGLFIMFLFVYKENDLEFLKFKQNKYRDVK